MTTARVVGGGPAGLMAAETLARAGVAVTVHERMPSPGRKFLLAGHGGLNITHSEELERFLARYGSSAPRIAPMLDGFGPSDLRAWCANLGEPTFVGSSGRVFPRAFRATPLFRAWLARLDELGVRIERRSLWSGWADASPADARATASLPADASPANVAPAAAITPTPLLLTDGDGTQREVMSDVVIFALGGASWPHLGADGAWTLPFAERGIAINALRAANVGVRVDWSAAFAERFAGLPLKNVALRVRDQQAAPARGDAMITRTGIEGGPIYGSGASIRAALDAAATSGSDCVLDIDLRPDSSVSRVADRLRHRKPKDSASNWLRRGLGLGPASVGLLREAGRGQLTRDADAAAALIKGVPVKITGTMPIDRAISSAGGIAWSEVDDRLMLRRMPGTFVAGEMLDWEAPTGGYLLQASFSMGVAAARGALEWLADAQAGR